MTNDRVDAPDLKGGRSRYPGTRPFSDSAEDRQRFFGRLEEVEQLYLRVLSVRLLVQFGKSGLGKTSLLQAGLFPRLREKPFLPIMIRLNSVDESLTAAVLRSLDQACKDQGRDVTVGNSDGLWELLSGTTVWADDLLLTPVLVFDQFEEVFTLRDARFRNELAAELGALTTGIAPARLRPPYSAGREEYARSPHAKMVISLREDYLGSLQEFSAAIPGLFQELLRLEGLGDKSAAAAITQPALLKAGPGEEPFWAPSFEFDTAALQSMIAYLKGKSGVIEPFQLQLLCRHAEAIAHAKSDAQGGPITLAVADFTGAKAFDTVMNNFYRQTLEKLDSSQRRRAEELCEVGLVDTAGHRLMLEEGQIQREFGVTPQTLSMLTQERLLRRERRLESAFYEISHDRLADSILKAQHFRLPKNLRRAFVTAAIAVPIVIGVVIWRYVSLDNERKNTADALQTVVAEQQKTNGLLGFLLSDFLDGVRDTGRSTMLEQVQNEVTDTGATTGESLGFVRALALRNEGDIKRTHGSIGESITLFEQALRGFEATDDTPGRRETARTQDRLAEALADQGHVAQALVHYNAAVDDWRQIIANAAGPDSDDCLSLADALVSAGDLEGRLGQTSDSRRDLHDATTTVSDILFGRRTDTRRCGGIGNKVDPYFDAKALEVLSRAAISRASTLALKEDYEGGAALALGATALRPASISARKNSLVALAWRGNGRALESPESAIEDYRDVSSQFEELRRRDPSNRLWQRELAASQLLVTEGMIACNAGKKTQCKPLPSMEEAEAMGLSAIATLRALAQADKTNNSLQVDLAWALRDRAKVLAAGSADRGIERLAVIEEAERIYVTSRLDKADIDAAANVGTVLQDKAAALMALNRPAEAREALQESIKVFQGLSDAHPENIALIGGLIEARGLDAEFRRKQGDRAGAEAALRDRESLNKKSSTLDSKRQQKAGELLEAITPHVKQGGEWSKRGDDAAALHEFEAAESATREYVALSPDDSFGYSSLRGIYVLIRATEQKLPGTQGDPATMVAALNAAQIAALLAPSNEMKTKMDLLDARGNLGRFLFDEGRTDEALAMVQEEVSLSERLLQNGKQEPAYLWRVGNTKCGLGRVRRELKQPGWEEAIRSGLIYAQRASKADTRNVTYLAEVAQWRLYLGNELTTDGRVKDAAIEYRIALNAYQKLARLEPANQDAAEGLRQLAKLGVR